MILQLVIVLILSAVAFPFAWLPDASVLPWGIDSILVSAVGGFKSMIVVFPPLGIVFQAFMIYLLFRVGMQLLKGVPFLGRTIS